MLMPRVAAAMRLALLALVVGACVAAVAAVFKGLIDAVSFAFFGYAGVAAPDLLTRDFITQHAYILAAPAVGGLLVGIFLQLTRKRYGVPETVISLEKAHGAIPYHAAPHTAAANALTLGSGMSAGAEGPLVQIGSAVGSAVARIAKLASAERRLLLAGGGAASFAILFGAPFAGVLFATEVILRQVRLRHVWPIVISAFVAVGVSGLFGVRGLTLSGASFDSATLSWWAPLVILVLLGLFCAAAAVVFVRSTHVLIEHTQRFIRPIWLRTTVAGFCVGAIAWVFPQVLGVGEATMQTLLSGESGLALGVLAGLAVAKIIATSLTLGLGVPGGCLFPSLFIGAAVGAAFDAAMPGAWAATGVIGAACVLAVVVRAPLTAILLVAAVVPAPTVVVAAIIAVTVSMYSAHYMQGVSMYAPALAAQGIVARASYMTFSAHRLWTRFKLLLKNA